MSLEKILMECIGWFGSLLVVLAYALLSVKKLSSNAKSYQLMNLFGSIFLVVFTAYKEAYPPATVNTIWAIFALISLTKQGDN
jgi:hypothetical protein